MPPKFALQSVLDYHHERVDKLEGEFGRLVQLKVKALETLVSYENDMERILGDLKELQTGEMDLQAIRLNRTNLKRVENNIEKQHQVIRNLEKEIEKKQIELILARQDEAVFEKLKEKELERFNEKIITQDKILQDDIYISKAHRQPARKYEDTL